MLETIFTNSVNNEKLFEFIDFDQSDNQHEYKCRNCFFLCVAHVLCQDRREYYRFRCFFSYINRCFANLSDNHVFYGMNQEAKQTPDYEQYHDFYCNYVKKLSERLFNCSKDFRETHKLPEDHEIELIDQESHRILFNAAAAAFVDENFKGKKFDLKVLSSVFRCDFRLFQAYVLSRYDNNKCRQWHLLMNTNPPFAMFTQDLLSHPFPVYMLASVIDIHFIAVNFIDEHNNDPVDSSEAEKKVSRKRTVDIVFQHTS
jgi:hypothetical protein